MMGSPLPTISLASPVTPKSLPTPNSNFLLASF